MSKIQHQQHHVRQLKEAQRRHGGRKHKTTAEQQFEGETMSRLSSIHFKTQPLKPHELVSTSSSRCEGLQSSGSTTATPSGQDRVETLLNDCPYDMYLGLRWYRSDPLPSIICACEEQQIKFIDNEFPVHDQVHLEVCPPQSEVIKCIPGVITSSNCRDFVTVPKRVPRIQHFLNKAKCDGGGWNWKRASSLHNNDETCSLFSASSQSIDPRNVIQGKVGNCGFCSGIASVAAGFPDVINNVFGQHSQLSLSMHGAISVLMYPRGQPRYLLLDDYILCKNEKDCDTYHGRNPPSPSMHSLLKTDVWVRLLEKAFVKVQGSYASLDGYYKYNSLYRHPARAMQLLTGAPLAMEVHYSTADADIMYKILKSTQGQYAKVVHCRKRYEGLIPNHGYSLLWAGEGNGEHWVCLRNPHGHGSYKGRGFDGSSLCMKDGKLLPKCLEMCDITGRVVWKQHTSVCHPVFSLKDCNHDNGIFFVDFQTFIECFPITTLVGPIKAKLIDVVGRNCVERFDLISDKDCVHEVHKGDLPHLCDILTTSQESS